MTRGSVSATCSPLPRLSWPPGDEPGRSEAIGSAALTGAKVSDDVEERLQPSLHAGVGGVGVDFENQIGLGAHLRRQHRLRKGVDGAAEIAHAEQEQIVDAV